MKKILFFLLFVGFFTNTNAQTFSEDIAPIIYNNCTSCHRLGEIGPMPLTSYTEIQQWAQMIAYVTEIKYMPPWKPDKNYSHFVGEKGLTDQEIQLIQDWVSNGTIQGNPANEPPIPSFPDGSQLGTPDLVLSMTEAYQVPGNNQDDYRVFVLPTSEIQDRELAAIEFRPGNASVVHHALVTFDDTGAGAALDAQSPEYGYFSYGDFGTGNIDFNTGYTPGIQTVRYPTGMGEILPTGADVLVQIHYAPIAVSETDQSSINLFFKDPADPIEREIQLGFILPNSLPGGWADFYLLANEVKTFHGTFPISQDISVFQIYPHAHLLCRSWEVYALTSQNENIPLIKIDDWDFNWQGAYTFERMKKIPAGSTIHVIATYDNTADNPQNPNNPPEFVTWGEGTQDEMYIGLLNFVPYQEGDEHIVVGDNLTGNTPEVDAYPFTLYAPYPNPAIAHTRISYYLPESATLDIGVFTLDGKRIKSVINKEGHSAGNHHIDMEIADLSIGTYLVIMDISGQQTTQKMVVMR